MGKIQRAVISLSDKSGIVQFAKDVQSFGVEILSTGGTAKTLRESGLKIMDVSEYTGFPEMLDGRVKTLHPKIHGGLLGIRDNPEHVKKMKEHGIIPIDMVVVNLYPFEATVAKPSCTLEEAIENIDIGGPSMLRAAAKNYSLCHRDRGPGGLQTRFGGDEEERGCGQQGDQFPPGQESLPADLELRQSHLGVPGEEIKINHRGHREHRAADPQPKKSDYL